MADLVQIGPGETDLGKIVAALRAVIERFPASEDLAAASAGALIDANNLSDLDDADAAIVNLGVDAPTPIGDTNYTILPEDRIIRLTALLTAPRTWTLPAASAARRVVIFTGGGINGANTLTIARAGSDVINPGGATSFVLGTAGEGIDLLSNGTSSWAFGVPGVAQGGTGASTAASARTSLGLSYGLQTIWLPAAGMVGYVGAAPGQTTYSSGNFSAITFDFDQTTQENVVFQITMPKSWDKGNLFFVPYWTATGGTGTVAWKFFPVAISDNEVLNASLSGTITSTDTFQNADRLHIAPITSGLTPDGSPANDDLILFALARDVANDTLTADARLIGVKILYTVSAGNDS